MELILALTFGLIIGSFLNVCIWRVPRELSVVNPPRSYCPKCNRKLAWWENIPVLSWAALRCRCRTCKQPISGQYPLVEILSGIAAVASCLHFGVTFSALIIYALTAALIVITFIDFEFKIIPNVISFPGMTIGLILGAYSQYEPLTPPLTQGAFDSLTGLLFGGGFFYIIGIAYYALTGRVGLGGGDIKLMGMVGAFLGWRSIAPTVFAGSLFGAVIGVCAMIISGQGRQTEIPFGPWLSLGALLYIFADVPFFRLYF